MSRLSARQQWVLSSLLADGSGTAVDLAERAGISRASILSTLNKMRAARLVDREGWVVRDASWVITSHGHAVLTGSPGDATGSEDLTPDPRPEKNVPTRQFLYRFFDADDRLLYVGISKDPIKRFAQHAKDQPWWGDVARRTTTAYGSRAEVENAEAIAIAYEGPVHNKVRPDQRRLAVLAHRAGAHETSIGVALADRDRWKQAHEQQSGFVEYLQSQVEGLRKQLASTQRQLAQAEFRASLASSMMGPPAVPPASAPEPSAYISPPNPAPVPPVGLAG